MNKLKTLVLLSAVLLLGCKSEQIDLTDGNDTQPKTEALADKPDVEKGIIRVKLTRETGDNLNITGTSGQLRSGQSGIDAYLKEMGAKSMKRVFPYAGKFEERTRLEGLHLWYDIAFDESKSVTRAASDARNIQGVEIVEEVPVYTRPPHTLFISDIAGTRASNATPFNDPMLSRQWHYNNLGNLNQPERAKFVLDADCNLFEAWEKETGKPNVIVAVQDGGVDVTHEDLKDNMWVNEAELNGVAGVDDDGNGFIDDIHGFDFHGNNGKIDADDHGSHVAGTVAARNNNGIGVCGVAGGNGKPGTGVRIMTCQMFTGKASGGATTAMKYQADNGAVISQNSWGGGSFGSSMQAAIDYFIKYAGCDNKGEQLPTSPMKGGVVIFAAGNDNVDALSYPAAYPPVVAVSAMAPDYKKSHYTNRGDWVDIMAPGGGGREFSTVGNVLSSVVGNKYGWMSGTSMACPHVSGIAALIVSHFGKPGFTNKMLEDKLLTALRPRDINKENPGFEGRLGRGYIDAARALDVNQNKKPEDIASVSIKEDYTSIEMTWKAVKDEDDKTALFYRLYYSDKEVLTAGNYKKAQLISVSSLGEKPGEDIIYKLQNLVLNTTYYFAMVAEDRWGLQSAPIFFTGKTKENFPPKLKRTGDEKIRITGTETAEVKIMVDEPDGQEWTYTAYGQKTGITILKESDGIRLKFKAIAPIGQHKVSVRVADIFDASATMEIPFEIYENHPPKLAKEFAKVFIPVNKNDYTLNLAEYFKDEDGHAMTFTARSLDPSTAGVTLKDGKLTLDPSRVGLVSIEVAATDTQDSKTHATFQLQIVKDELVYIMYPVPVTKILNVRLSDTVENATLSIRTATGTQVYRQDITATTPEQRMVQLDLSKLAGGSYMLHVEANGKAFKQSFIKQ